MPHDNSKGLAEIPIVLIISVFLATVAISVGYKGLGRAESIKTDQKAIDSFSKFAESSKRITYGEIGENQLVDLDLPNSYIEIKNDLIQLKKGKEKLRSEYLSLPLIKRGSNNYKLYSGEYLLELRKASNLTIETEHTGLILTIKEISHE